jgi:lipoprotein-anchoring transpeptidase ErfK/SrfK
MTGTVGDDEAYSVEDVPWVQYLHLNIALHGSFWHSSYGRPKSHGCINLAPADARRLFEWTDPKMPDGWHGIAANDKNPGTLVIIEGETPK